MDCSTPGFLVLHHLPEFAQTHFHWVGDAFQLSHPVSPASSAFSLSQHQFSSAQFSRSVVSDSLQPHESQHARPPCLSITNARSSLKLKSIKLVMLSSHLILCCPLFLLPPIPPSIRVFSNESTLRMRWPKYWSFSFSIILSKEIPGLISFRMDWLDLLAVQGTLKHQGLILAELNGHCQCLTSGPHSVSPLYCLWDFFFF